MAPPNRPLADQPSDKVAARDGESSQRPHGTDHPAAAARSRRDLPAVSGHQDALDGIRAIAAFAVLVIHVGGETGYAFSGTPASWAVSRGDIGVPIFFTLSGLLLFRPWARAILQGTQAPQVGPYPWWPGTGATGLAQMWSLSVEVSFYLALPLIAAALGWLAHRVGPDVNLRATRLL